VSTEPGAPDPPQDDRERAGALLEQLAGLPDGDARRGALRAEVVELSMPLVAYLAQRFRGRGESVEDLIQVGMEGLLKAVDRFEVERGISFTSYAAPTIIGEMRRHLRDRTGSLRIPRRLYELRASLADATTDLTHSLGRSPTIDELAARLEVDPELVLETLESLHAAAVTSLDAPGPDGEGEGLASSIAALDSSLELVELRASLSPLVSQLPEREQRILAMRFTENLTQSQIAQRLGISQMHVSRLLSRTLEQLRHGLVEEG
jgi:RNA polymerase sigma-B factor